MRIFVSKNVMGFSVRLSADGERFASLLSSFESSIPARCRRFNRSHWFVHKRAGKRLNSWLEQVKQTGAVVDYGREAKAA